jgi:hypothetical protein
MAQPDVATPVLAEDKNLPNSTADEVMAKGDPSATRFTMFKELPTELRLKIWHAALPNPRTIILHKVRRARIDDYRQLGPDAVATGPSKVPALLQVNQEVRHETLKCYQLCFKDHMNGTQLYFNYERDILVFRDYSALSVFYQHYHGPEVSLIKHENDLTSLLEHEVRLRFIAIGCHLDAFSISVLSRFRQLEMIAFQTSSIQTLQHDSRALKLRLSQLSSACLDAADQRGQVGFQMPETEAIHWHQSSLRFPVIPRPSVTYADRMSSLTLLVDSPSPNLHALAPSSKMPYLTEY